MTSASPQPVRPSDRLEASSPTPALSTSAASRRPSNRTPAGGVLDPEAIEELRREYEQYGASPGRFQIPPRSGTGTPAQQPGTDSPLPGSSVAPTPLPQAESNDGTPNASGISLALEGLTDEDKARVLRRHLVAKEEGTPDTESNRLSRGSEGSGNGDDSAVALDDNNSGVNSGVHLQEETERYPTPLHKPGADVVHDLYAWQRNARQEFAARGRSASLSRLPPPSATPSTSDLDNLRQPGGFRRHHIRNRAREAGREEPRVLNSFVDFLLLYGGFAGEELEEGAEDEDESAEEQEEAEEGRGRGVTERTPLMAKRKRSVSAARHGDATVLQAVLMLLKSFVGTGVLFLGRAFLNGGLLFSTVFLVLIAGISLWSFLLLVNTRLVIPASFGDIGGILYGKWMRIAILTSIAVSQMGFVSAYTVFVAENLQSFIVAVTHCRTVVPVQYLILAQIPVFGPLALYRDLAKLSFTALVADAFILIGIIYLFGQETAVLVRRGLADVKLFNPKDFPLLIGTAVFAFEGIGLIIPVTESMREPQKFPAVLCGVMVGVTTLFAASGFMSYAAFGSKIHTVVISNLPQDDKFVQTVQFLYSVAIVLSIPLQLFPAVRIMESGLFSKSGKHNRSVKWQKNLFRLFIVALCIVVSTFGATDLDKFVSLIGSVACVPLCFIYPPLLHLKACARTRLAKALDIGLLVIGFCTLIFTSSQTIALLASSGSSKPDHSDCR